MNYAYYPGCSLETTGKPYDQSVRAVFKALDIGLTEIEDWNCCGATMYMSVDQLVGYAVSARNLALAQNMGCDICAPCSSCYTILRKTNRQFKEEPKSREQINEALKAANLAYTKPVEVRHPLDILVNDYGINELVAKTKFRFDGLRVAPYYGCQIVRPMGFFDDVDDPQTMDRVLDALGCEVVPYPHKVRCCGGMLMTTFDDVALNLNNELIRCAEDNDAEVIATACPLCQMNLEAYQPQINTRYQTKHQMPVVYFSQLIGLALGIDAATLGLDSLMIKLANPKLKAKEAKRALA